jgi:hypothetical protein
MMADVPDDETTALRATVIDGNVWFAIKEAAN